MEHPIPLYNELKVYNGGLRRLEIGFFAATLGLAFCLQWARGAYTSDFASHPDEAAHVVSSLLVRDYMTQGIPQNPLTFARAYYAHYPKVAIGHWPPLFHATEAFWTLIFGRSKPAMISWIAVLGAGVTTLLFVWVRTVCGPVAGCFAAVVFFASALVQEALSSVMLDLLLTLLAFAAAVCLGAFLQFREKRYAAWFTILAAAAVATNGRGIAIALLWIPTFALLSRSNGMRWLAALAVMVGIFLLPNLFPGAAPFSLSPYSQFLQPAAGVLSWPVAALAILGSVTVFRNRFAHPEWVPVLGLLLSVLLFQVLGNWPFEARYFLPVAPALAALAALGCRACLDPLRAPLRLALLALLVCAVLLLDVPHYSRKRDLGYHSFAKERLAQTHTTSLIAGDPVNEGSFIAEMDLADSRPAHVVLRGSKVLADSTWAGQNYQMRFFSSGEVSAWLDRTDVTLVIVQIQGSPHVSQLLEAVRLDTQHWHQLPIAPFPRNVRVFERWHEQ